MARAGEKFYDVETGSWQVRTHGRGGRVVHAESDEGREAIAEREARAELAAEERERRSKQAVDQAVRQGYVIRPAGEPDASPPAGIKPSRRSPTTRRPSTRPPRTTGRASSKPSRLQRFARSGYRRSGAQGQVASWGDLAWQLTGLVIGLALLTLFISSSGGVSAFGGILGGFANGLGLIVDPVDPLAKGAVANTVERASSPAAPTIPIKAAGAPRTMVAPAGVHV